MVERLCESAIEVGQEVIRAAKNEPRWREVAAGMVHAWNEGMASIRSVRSESSLKGLSAYIKAAGFSNPPKPEAPMKIGHSDLLARRRPKQRRQAASAKTTARKKR
jgi:serine/threonine-protein kinase HipA